MNILNWSQKSADVNIRRHKRKTLMWCWGNFRCLIMYFNIWHGTELCSMWYKWLTCLKSGRIHDICDTFRFKIIWYWRGYFTEIYFAYNYYIKKTIISTWTRKNTSFLYLLVPVYRSYKWDYILYFWHCYWDGDCILCTKHVVDGGSGLL